MNMILIGLIDSKGEGQYDGSNGRNTT